MLEIPGPWGSPGIVGQRNPGDRIQRKGSNPSPWPGPLPAPVTITAQFRRWICISWSSLSNREWDPGMQ